MAGSVLMLLALFAAVVCSNDQLSSSTIEKDVVIIGGGAGGAHVAIRLKDMGHDILLIEKQDKLGGCVDSYDDPTTGTPIDYGVFSFVDYANATQFMARLNISTTAPVNALSTTRYVDFTTGKELNNYTPPLTSDMIVALETYLPLCEKYEDMLVPGYWHFPDASDIPDELLMNFGDFVNKHNLSAAVPIMYSTTALGVGKPADELVMTVMQAFGGQMTRSLLGLQSSFIPASHRNQDIYDAIAQVLGSDVMYSTTVASTSRSANEVTINAQDHSTGVTTTIKSERLIIAINPTLDRMKPFDLDEEEISVFSKWQYSRLYASLVTNPSLPHNDTSIANLPLGAEPAHYLDTPSVPYGDDFQNLNTTDHLFHILAIGNESLSATGAQQLLQSELDTLLDSRILNANEDSKLNFVAFSDHGPMHLRVSADDYRAGFVQDQYALQGHRSTWYTGGGYASQFQTIIWAYNDILIQEMFQT